MSYNVRISMISKECISYNNMLMTSKSILPLIVAANTAAEISHWAQYTHPHIASRRKDTKNQNSGRWLLSIGFWRHNAKANGAVLIGRRHMAQRVQSAIMLDRSHWSHDVDSSIRHSTISLVKCILPYTNNREILHSICETNFRLEYSNCRFLSLFFKALFQG